MPKLSPQMRHQRKAALKLVLLSLSIFLVSLWGVKEEGSAQAEVRKGTATMKAPPRPPKAEAPKTWSPGGRVEVPLEEGSTEGSAEGLTVAEVVAGVTPAVQDCLVQWWMMDSALEGDVRLELTVGPAGLAAARVVDHDGVPEGVVGCLGGALGAGVWPGSAEVVVTVGIPVFSS